MQSRFFIFIIFSCSLVLFACTSRSKSAEDDSQKFLTNHELFELFNVYDSLAMFSPKIGCDTEADWAAEEAHKIALNAQNLWFLLHIAILKPSSTVGMAFFVRRTICFTSSNKLIQYFAFESLSLRTTGSAW